MTNSSFLTALISVLGLLVLVGGSIGTVAAIRVGKNTQTVENYEKNAASWKELAEASDAKIEHLQEQNADLQHQNAEQAKLIADLQGKIAVLQDVVTGKTAVETMAQEMRHALTSIGNEVAANKQAITDFAEEWRGSRK